MSTDVDSFGTMLLSAWETIACYRHPAASLRADDADARRP